LDLEKLRDFWGNYLLQESSVICTSLRPKREWAFWRKVAFICGQGKIMVAFLTFQAKGLRETWMGFIFISARGLLRLVDSVDE
jgi:hypothetical protein